MLAEQGIIESYLSSPDFYAGETSISIEDAFAENFLATSEKIRSFHKLPLGWHYGSGAPISLPMCNSALDWLEFLSLLGYSKIDAFPGEDGEILLAADFDDNIIEFTLEIEGRFSISHERPGYDDVYYSKIDASRAYNIISEIAGNEWSAYDYFIPTISIGPEIDSLALHSKILPGAEFPLYQHHALLLYPQANVIISGGFIQAKPEILQYSGNSIQIPFQYLID